MITCEDTETIIQFQNGNLDAFDSLARKYAPRIYNLGMRMCKAPEDAKDLMQDTLLQAFRGLQGFKGESKFSVWIYQIAKRNYIDRQRKNKVTPDQLLPLDTLVPTEDERETLELADWRNTPVQKLLNMELRKELDQAMAQLPEDHRIVLVLRDVEGFTADETATILGLHVPGIKSRLHRARLAIRKHLHHYYREA